MLSIFWDLAPCVRLPLSENWLAANVSKSQCYPPSGEAPALWGIGSCTVSAALPCKAAPPGVVSPSSSPHARKDLEMW